MAQSRVDFSILTPEMMELTRLSPSFEMEADEGITMADDSTGSMRYCTLMDFLLAPSNLDLEVQLSRPRAWLRKARDHPLKAIQKSQSELGQNWNINPRGFGIAGEAALVGELEFKWDLGYQFLPSQSTWSCSSLALSESLDIKLVLAYCTAELQTKCQG